MKEKLKIGLFIIIIGVLLVPLKRNIFSFIKEKPLQGSFKLAEKTSFSKTKWLSGDFQKEYQNYFRDHIGFRTSLIRINNQVKYSLFNKTNAKDVQIGKDNYLFEGGYIRDYMGYNFIGEDAISKKIKELKDVQIDLKRNNTDFLVVFAPGKASYFPEYIPTKYDTSKKTISNQLIYPEKCKEYGLDHIDFNSFFNEYKKTNRHRIFPKGGIHWGEYAVALAIDSLAKKIEKERGLNLQDFEFSDISYSEKLTDSDKDISNAMNLIFKYPSYNMPTLNYVYSRTTNVSKPKLLIIGDSYAGRIVSSPLTGRLFRDVEYWYYNRDSQFWYYNKKENSTRENNKLHAMSRVRGEIKNLNVREELKRFDIVLLLSTETNLFKFDFGFSDSYNNSLQYDYSKIKDYNYYMKRISNDKKWMEYIAKRAEELSIPLDSSLRKNASEMASKYVLISTAKTDRKEMDRRWLKKVKKQAKKKNIKIRDSMYLNGARW